MSSSLSVPLADDSIFLKTLDKVSFRFGSFFAFLTTLTKSSLGRI
jgi:hypothetical protein